MTLENTYFDVDTVAVLKWWQGRNKNALARYGIEDGRVVLGDSLLRWEELVYKGRSSEFRHDLVAQTVRRDNLSFTRVREDYDARNYLAYKTYGVLTWAITEKRASEMTTYNDLRTWLKTLPAPSSLNVKGVEITLNDFSIGIWCFEKEVFYLSPRFRYASSDNLTFKISQFLLVVTT